MRRACDSAPYSGGSLINAPYGEHFLLDLTVWRAKSKPVGQTAPVEPMRKHLA